MVIMVVATVMPQTLALMPMRRPARSGIKAKV